MTITIGYTNSDAVRAAVGVTDNEFPDTALSSLLLEKALYLDLYQWVPTHAAVHAAGVASGATTEAQMKASSLELYSTWFAARQIANTPFGVLNKITDGKEEVARFLDAKVLAQVAAHASSQLAEYRQQLEDLQGSAAVTVSVMGAATPSYNPVTNQ